MSCGSISPIDYGCGTSVRVDLIDRPEREKPKAREITITPLDYGFVLKVGCKSIALDSPEKILFGLKAYFKNPQKVEDAFLKGEFKFEK